MNTKTLSYGESFYSGGMFTLPNNEVLMVIHHAHNVMKLPGGTYGGLNESRWIGRGEGKEFYDINSPTAKKKKIENILRKSFSRDTFISLEKELDEVVRKIIQLPFHHFHLVIEMIEEVGIIPTDIVDISSSKKDFHTKYIMGIEKALTIKEGSLIEVKSTEDLPENKVDFWCLDPDVADQVTLTFAQIQKGVEEHDQGIHFSNREFNLNNAHVEALRNLLFNSGQSIQESDEEKMKEWSKFFGKEVTS